MKTTHEERDNYIIVIRKHNNSIAGGGLKRSFNYEPYKNNEGDLKDCYDFLSISETEFNNTYYR